MPRRGFAETLASVVSSSVDARHDADFSALQTELQRAYAQPQRVYHTVAHLEDCLRQFDTASELTERPDEVELAIWFHDAVYDPRANDNEQRSAGWARRTLAEAGAPLDVIDRVAALVLLTRHVDLPTSRDGELLLDIDLSILAREPDEFARYDAQIREEYAWVPEVDYRRGRAEILERFLRRPALFHTELFRQRFERQARQNLAAAIAALR